MPSAEDPEQCRQHLRPVQESHAQPVSPEEVGYHSNLLLPEQQAQLSLNGCEYFNCALLMGTEALLTFSGPRKHITKSSVGSLSQEKHRMCTERIYINTNSGHQVSGHLSKS